MPKTSKTIGLYLYLCGMAALQIIGCAAVSFALDVSAAGAGWSPIHSNISPYGTTLTSTSSATLLTITAAEAETWTLDASVSIVPAANAAVLEIKGTGNGTPSGASSLTWQNSADTNFISLVGAPTTLATGDGTRLDIPFQYQSFVPYSCGAGTYAYTVTFTVTSP